MVWSPQLSDWTPNKDIPVQAWPCSNIVKNLKHRMYPVCCFFFFSQFFETVFPCVSLTVLEFL